MLISWGSPLQASLRASRMPLIRTLPKMSPSFTVYSGGGEGGGILSMSLCFLSPFLVKLLQGTQVLMLLISVD